MLENAKFYINCLYMEFDEYNDVHEKSEPELAVCLGLVGCQQLLSFVGCT